MLKQGGKVESLNQPNSEKKEYSDEDLNRDCLSNEKVIVIFLLGGPGSGKSTQSRKIVEQFGFVHISAGDLLREESESGSERSVMIRKCMERGELVPSDVITGLLQRAMQKSAKKKILIDGFPRSLENRASFETLTGIEPEFVLYLDCPEELLKQRLLKRNEGRKDDNIDTITKRFEGLKSMLSVIEFYDLKGKVHKIDAEKSVEDVFEEIKPIFHH